MGGDLDAQSPEFRKAWKSVDEDLRSSGVGLDRRKTRELADKVVGFMDTMRDKSPAYWHSRGEDSYDVLSRQGQGNPLVLTLMANAGKVTEIDFRIKADVEALIATTALIRHRLDKGMYPEKLQQLVNTGYLKAVPIDPFSDKPIIYKRSAASFTLYSLGADFDDDGGLHSNWGRGEKGGDQVFWPVK